MEGEKDGSRAAGSPTTRRSPATPTPPRGTNPPPSTSVAAAAAVDSLRRRHVQAEMRLRELEDRFRRDCSRQEQELELLRLDNTKYKAKIEELRMAQADAQPRTSLTSTDSKLLRASSRKYRSARACVERAREELMEINAKLVSARQRLHELRRRRSTSHKLSVTSAARSRQSRTDIEIRAHASRLQLRGLEAHVETETDRLSKLMDAVKTLREDIDVQFTAQNRSDDLYSERERELLDVMRETSFLVEVCNVLFEERDDCQLQLAEMQRTAAAEHEAYEHAFVELVAVEDRDRTTKTRLRENLVRLQDDVAEAVREREAAELVVREERAALQRGTVATRGTSSTASNGGMGLEGSNEREDVDDDGNGSEGIQRQLEEFERYLTRLAQLAGSDDLDDVQRFVCGGSDERFQLYTALNHIRDDISKLEQERDALLRETAANEMGIEKGEGGEKGEEGAVQERRMRKEVEELQENLREIQRVTLDHVQHAECAKTYLDSTLPVIDSIFTALDCDDTRIVAEHGSRFLSRETLELFLASIEQRLEEYMAVWVQSRPQKQQEQQQQRQRLLLANPKSTTTTTAAGKATISPRLLPSTGDQQEEDAILRDRSIAEEPIPTEVIRAAVTKEYQRNSSGALVQKK
ncbi:uncharacterized protein TM35_000362010 [Trypanosoma theileri]|uniref:ODAD1 central coiled coil region domain-containing protein n=1 Tax=Trypanosoma theileri TaxID=67003 RepID=A0A1X0NL89_9TRYP|nr:uncharacterized protein TM35_000362010 [Trypanosoma theileri]ORC85341.1 hypothetical protein TM35_000362010 [Trypanosoma theileri]